MRSLTLSITLLGAAFLWGCQEQASSPVGLDGLRPQFGAKKCVRDNTLPGCSGGDEAGGQGGVLANLEMTGGMTASGQTVEFLDGNNTLIFGSSLTLAMALSATEGAGIDACTPFSRKKAVNPDFATLFSKLTDGSQVRQLFVHIDKNALTDASNEHAITVVWTDGDGSFNASVGRISPNMPGTSTVTLSGNLSPSEDVTVTFTGGSIRLRDKTDRVPEHFHLTCPIPAGDAITMTLSLP